jgi:predicted xylose isomerase-like sugar epimerase
MKRKEYEVKDIIGDCNKFQNLSKVQKLENAGFDKIPAFQAFIPVTLHPASVFPNETPRSSE